ncbi:MAG: zeta toxin family protein [Bacteroidetes bacterium]|nr:zeta toxin family protein [Bacteroidota bacterium]
MPNLYIIAGCNGAGKTTASNTILPEILHCREFVNADNIAAGISPFNPDGAAIEAGRIMLTRINQLITEGKDFAFETTLSTRSYVSLVRKAQSLGFKVTLVFIWLSSPQAAKERVAIRVKNGGHFIPDDVVERRYYRGIENLVKLFMPICDYWMIGESALPEVNIIATGNGDIEIVVENYDIWDTIMKQANNER